MKKALITGITGQDGSYLTEFLLSRGYEVHGIIRRSSTFNTERIEHLYVDPHKSEARLFLHYGDLSDPGELTEIIYNIKPEEVYHLGAQSHVRVSFDMAEYTGNITGLGTIRLLDAIKRSGVKARFYQASSSELFGAASPPQNENTPFYPRSPYAAAKLYAYWVTVNYREAYNLFAVNGILFNHESPRRGETFVTRKVTRTVARIKAGLEDSLYMGNLEAKRDWGFAPEYVECMYLMLQNSSPEDFVIGTGESHSVRELLKTAFGYVNLDYHDFVKIDPKYMRPTEVESLVADAEKARRRLNWSFKIGFEELIKIMVDADLKKVGLQPIGEGERILKEKFPKRWWRMD